MKKSVMIKNIICDILWNWRDMEHVNIDELAYLFDLCRNAVEEEKE